MLEPFLKKYYPYKTMNIINDDTTNNCLNTFPIYVINLRDDKLRRNYIKHIFLKHQINYYLIIVDKFKYNSQRDCIRAKIHPSKLGCILSHLWCIQDAITNGYTRFIIFEDDIIFHKKFKHLFNQIIDSDIINKTDMLMLGSIDVNLNHNLTHFKNNESVYFPTKRILGAHANIYKLEFAKHFLNYKLNCEKILEFDTEYQAFMKDHKIGICMPNLVVCELSTTNINHHYSPFNGSGFNIFRSWFPQNFTYPETNEFPATVIFPQTFAF